MSQLSFFQDGKKYKILENPVDIGIEVLGLKGLLTFTISPATIDHLNGYYYALGRFASVGCAGFSLFRYIIPTGMITQYPSTRSMGAKTNG